jgi:hypothetical protein
MNTELDKERDATGQHYAGPASRRRPGLGNRWNWAVKALAARTRSLGDWLFREDDARARRHGWQVHAGHGGLSRTYRDPRFDSLQGCPACHGTGADENNLPCGHCSGTGRIRLGNLSTPDSGRGR